MGTRWLAFWTSPGSSLGSDHLIPRSNSETALHSSDHVDSCESGELALCADRAITGPPPIRPVVLPGSRGLVQERKRAQRAAGLWFRLVDRCLVLPLSGSCGGVRRTAAATQTSAAPTFGNVLDLW